MADIREIYGADAWQRERFDLLAEESARISHGAQTASLFTATPVQVVESSPDGHNAVLQPVTKLKKVDPTNGNVLYEDYAPFPDTPIHFAGGGGVTATHPVAQGDEGIVLHAARDFDAWRSSGGTQPPMDNTVSAARTAMHIPGVRSDPRKLQQVSTTAHHVRSDDKRHVSEVHPQNGITHTSVDPSTPPASMSFDPSTMATTFYQHIIQGVAGILGSATSAGTTHTHGITHTAGAFMTALNGAHSVLAHPENGASLNAANLLHQVLCHPENGALMSALNGLHKVLAHPSIGAALLGGNGASSVIATAAGVAIQCPAGGLSLPAGSVGGGSLGAGAASQNVGALEGDLSGTLPNAQVVGITNVANANLLPAAASDAAAAALTPPVPVGGLYRNTAVMSGVSVLAVRMA